MRRAVAPLLLALVIVSPLVAQSAARRDGATHEDTSGPTTRYSRLYVFGDSYSDIGAGYIDGNGPTAVAYLGWLMGLQVASSKAANAAGKSLVFAVSGAGHFTIALLPTTIPQFAAVGLRLNPAYEQFVREEADAAGLDLWLNHWGAAFDEVMEHPAAHGIVNTTGACAGRAIFDQDPTPVGDPATYFFYHEGHPSTAVHRIVGKKLFEEIAARPPATR